MQTTNFAFLEQHDSLLFQLARTAEQAFVPDPNITLIKLRQLGEAFAQDIASRLGIDFDSQTKQVDLLKRIQFDANIQREVLDTFHAIRKVGNEATHEFTSNHREAMTVLMLAHKLSIWYHRTFGNAQKGWKPEKFIAPKDPAAELRAMEERILTLEKAQKDQQHELNIAQQLAEAEQKKAAELKKYADSIKEDSDTWQTLATEQEAELEKAKKAFELQTHKVAEANHEETDSAKANRQQAKKALEKSIWEENEAETRLRIDQQLRDAGWEADSVNLHFSKGIRPEVGRNMAIAEWEWTTGERGRADYALFIGTALYAVVEAKKTKKTVASDIGQAERYSRTIPKDDSFEFIGGPWPVSELDASKGVFHVPFVFATNGRPYLEQHKTFSGVWFRDVRHPENSPRANDGWYSPEGLQNLYKQDIKAAEARLADQSFQFDFKLRYYQINAIQAVEQALTQQQQSMLIAMATGTGKTKTCIALVFRLLQAQRFRRILFLVDRSALGEQTEDAFSSTQMLNQQTFADCFNIKGLKDAKADSSTQVHVATVQGMVKRVLYSDDAPTVDAYDCIVIDECHRGYLLDRELSDTEVEFRSQNDYISKYRRVLDYFDAVKIGLTATPAVHTAEIFGYPVYQYTYREAVIDGYLVDSEPTIRIITEQNQDGLTHAKGEEIGQLNTDTGDVDYTTLDDELNFDVTKLNRNVIAPSFNQVVLEAIADRIDPFSKEKTLIFCVDNEHASLVVDTLNDILDKKYGGVEKGLVKQITGSVDKPLEQIRHFKNERLPNIVVTVDLLTTGVDVPEICNLVFLRVVKSRILYEQMKGRATRLCPKIGKESFRIFDAVDLYKHLEPVTNMKPVVVSPAITFTQLIDEILEKEDDSHVNTARDQFLAKLQRKLSRLDERAKATLEHALGEDTGSFIKSVKTQSAAELKTTFSNLPDLGHVLDKQTKAPAKGKYFSDKEDALKTVEQDFGAEKTHDDYLEAFKQYIQDNKNNSIALKTLINQPGKITRKQIKDILLALDAANFTEKNLRAAWAAKNNQDIAARIVGYIRKAATGDALVPFEERVDNAIAVIIGQKEWNPAQKGFLTQLGKLLKTHLAVDAEALNKSTLKKQYGPFNRMNEKLFDGELPTILESINDALWHDEQQG